MHGPLNVKLVPVRGQTAHGTDTYRVAWSFFIHVFTQNGHASHSLHRKFLETTLTSADGDTIWMRRPTTINFYTTSCPLSSAQGAVISVSGFRWCGPSVVGWVLPDISKERNASISGVKWTKENHSWGIRSSGMLRSAGWWLVTDVSWQPIGPIFRDQAVLNPWRYCLTLKDTDWFLKILLDTWRYRLIVQGTAWSLKILLDPWRCCLTLDDTAWPLKILLNLWR
jgi:hypothetical protein